MIILQIIEKFPLSITSPLRKLHKLRRQDRRGSQQYIHQRHRAPPTFPVPDLLTLASQATLLPVTTTPAMTPTPNNESNSDDDNSRHGNKQESCKTLIASESLLTMTRSRTRNGAGAPRLAGGGSGTAEVGRLGGACICITPC